MARLRSKFMADGGSIPQTEDIPNGMQLDGRGGGFIPMGAKERKDDVPAMLAKNEFVMTADAVRAAGGGDVNKGAQKMYDLMRTNNFVYASRYLKNSGSDDDTIITFIGNKYFRYWVKFCFP